MVRLLIDCGNYVFFDNIINMEFEQTAPTIDVTLLEDTTVKCIQGVRSEDKFSVEMPLDTRTAELKNLDFSGFHNIRLEHLGADMGYEQKCYITTMVSEISPNGIAVQKIEFVGIDEAILGKVIPKEVMSELRCPNCGAPIKSRYGACDYCSGWVECEW